MVSDVSKKKAAQKKAVVAAKRGGKSAAPTTKAATEENGSISRADNLANGEKILVAAKQSGGIGENSSPQEKKLKILVADGGIGGLILALPARRKGFEVVVFERDLSAIRGEGQYKGKIQIQSNALAVLEAIDLDVGDEVIKAACITGDRINELVDGVSGNCH